MTEKNWTEQTIGQISHIAAFLARHCKAGDCIVLEGDLGAGKTTFARAFIHALQDKPEEVTSPTFTLLQQYDSRIGGIAHFDLYRVESSRELLEIGFRDALISCLCLVEWPQNAGGELPENALYISLSHAGETTRNLSVHSAGERWQHIIEAL